MGIIAVLCVYSYRQITKGLVQMKYLSVIIVFFVAYAHSQTTEQISEKLEGITIPAQIISDW